MKQMDSMRYSDNARTRTIETFAGLNRMQGAADGEFTDMENLACFHYPAMGTRKGRVLTQTFNEPADLFEWNGHLIVADGTTLYYDGEAIAQIAEGTKQFAVVNTKLVVWPDAIMVDLNTKKVTEFSPSVTQGAAAATLASGSLQIDLNGAITTVSANCYEKLSDADTQTWAKDFVETYDYANVQFADGVWMLPAATKNYASGMTSSLVGKVIMVQETDTEGLYFPVSGTDYIAGSTITSSTAAQSPSKKGFYGIIKSASTAAYTGAWRKYNCVVSSGSYNYYAAGQWVQTGSATHNGTGISTVYTSCSFSPSSGYIIGGATTVDMSTWSGTSYAGGGTSASMMVSQGYGNPITFYSATAILETAYYTTYSKGGVDYGYVASVEGARPDASNGYTYVKMEGNAVIMRNGSSYYWYEPVGSKASLTVEIRTADVADQKFSSAFEAGDRVSLSGTVAGLNDVENAKIVSINPSTNTLTFDDGTFILPEYYLLLSSGHIPGDYSYKAGNTNYTFTLTESTPAGAILFRLVGDSTTYIKVDGVTTGYTTTQASTGASLGTATAYPGESGPITVTRQTPDMDYICARDNRLYGVSNSTENRIYNSDTGQYETYTARCIYVSALGLPHRFWDFDGVDADSYQVAVASNGNFTGCVSYGGCTLFWKEDMLYKLYGDYPSNFGLYEYLLAGVQDGSHRSQKIIDEVLYYKGRDGVYAYTGSTPQLISYKLGYRRYTEATAGSDGVHYHICMKDSDGAFDLYTYDTVHSLWMREDDSEVKAFALIDGTIYGLIERGLYALEQETMTIGAESVEADPFSWYAVFPVCTETSARRKRYKWVRLRMDLAPGAQAKLESRFDGGQWNPEWQSEQTGEVLADIPITPNRCDRMELRLSGSGAAQLHMMTIEYSIGSERG